MPRYILTSDHTDCEGRTWPAGTPVQKRGTIPGGILVRAFDARGEAVTLVVPLGSVREDVAEPLLSAPLPIPPGQELGVGNVIHLPLRSGGGPALRGQDEQGLPVPPPPAIRPDRLDAPECSCGCGQLLHEMREKYLPIHADPEEIAETMRKAAIETAERYGLGRELPPGTPAWVYDAERQLEGDGYPDFPAAGVVAFLLAVGALLWAACYFI